MKEGRTFVRSRENASVHVKSPFQRANSHNGHVSCSIADEKIYG